MHDSESALHIISLIPGQACWLASPPAQRVLSIDSSSSDQQHRALLPSIDCRSMQLALTRCHRLGFPGPCQSRGISEVEVKNHVPEEPHHHRYQQGGSKQNFYKALNKQNFLFLLKKKKKKKKKKATTESKSWAGKKLVV